MTSILDSWYFLVHAAPRLAALDATGMWAIVGKGAVVVGLIGGILAIVRHFRTPLERLEAVVRRNSFGLPFKISNCLDDFYQKLKTEFSESQKSTGPFPLARAANFKSEWNSGVLRALDRCKSMTSLKIDNVGSKKCTGVTLTVPEYTKVVMWEKSDSTALTVGTREVELGDLAPKQTVHAWLWSIASPYSAGGVRITHDTGVAKLRFAYSTSKLGKSLESLGGFVVMAAVMVVTLAILLYTLRQMLPSKPIPSRRATNPPAASTPP